MQEIADIVLMIVKAMAFVLGLFWLVYFIAGGGA